MCISQPEVGFVTVICNSKSLYHTFSLWPSIGTSHHSHLGPKLMILTHASVIIMLGIMRESGNHELAHNTIHPFLPHLLSKESSMAIPKFKGKGKHKFIVSRRRAGNICERPYDYHSPPFGHHIFCSLPVLKGDNPKAPFIQSIKLRAQDL